VSVVSKASYPRFKLPNAVIALALVCCFYVSGCKKEAPAAAPAFQAMPVQVAPVALNSVPATESYVATIKSRRSSTMQPQVDGNLTKILVRSGQRVQAGQVLMQIDPLKQVATVESQVGTEYQQKAVYEYNQADVERQRKLFEAGIISKQVFDQAMQSFNNSKGAFNSASALTDTQKRQLAYYQIRAPFPGIVGDIPVHVGDYVSATTVLTTIDEPGDLEAYIYIPTERAAQIRNGLPVDIFDTAGTPLTHTTIDFLSPEVDNGLQSILAKAAIPSSSHLRNQQLVNARITWSTAPAPTVPVLAVIRIGGQAFVYLAQAKGAGFVAHQVPVTLGDTIGNDYPVLTGLKTGDKVIVSGLQFLQEGAPVMPLPPAPPQK
jgi:RND family efflux transporter MFP subunit